MYLDVFQCQGCGNIYQDRSVRPLYPGYQPKTPTPPIPVIRGLGQSEPYHVNIDPKNQGASPNPHTMFKVLCADCATAVRTAIDQALARR